MVSLKTLNYLSAQKKKDAIALLQKGRHGAAIYLMGYALEFSLKRKVGQTLGFNLGFPEYALDFNNYSQQIAAFNFINTGVQITKLRQVKNHDLKQLLTYSGAEARIIALYYTDWITINNWNPEDRYKIQKFDRKKTVAFINSVRIILNEID